MGVDLDNNLDNKNIYDYYRAVIRSSTDYYAFGSAMPNRGGLSGTYRYGFNGKENDPEEGWQDYGERMYNPKLGRFFSVDPITHEYPELTPYQFASNSPIEGIDLDGLEYLTYTYKVDAQNKKTLINTVDYRKTELKVGPLGGGIKVITKYHNGTEGSVFTPSPDNDIKKNLFNDVYSGPYNPKDIDKNGKIVDSYEPKPADVADARTKQHDLDYDAANASGPKAVFGNASKKVVNADLELAKTSFDIAGYYLVSVFNGQSFIDQATHEEVTLGTASSAVAIGSFFGLVGGAKTAWNSTKSATKAIVNTATELVK